MDGAGWRELGGSASGGGLSSTSGASRVPTVATDAAGMIHVAWYDDSSGDNEIYVRRWR